MRREAGGVSPYDSGLLDSAAICWEGDMARVFITGSADGLGLMAGRLLIEKGHRVVLHARNEGRAEVARKAAPGAEGVIVGDLSTLAEMKKVAEKANALGRFDAVIHNAALGDKEQRRVETADGFAQVFAVNALAPLVLTALMERPKRLVYVSSQLHASGDASLRDVAWREKKWNGFQAYCDSKLHNVLLAFAVAEVADGLFECAAPGLGGYQDGWAFGDG